MQGISTHGDLIAGGYTMIGISGTRERRTASSSVAAESEATQPRAGTGTCEAQIRIKIFPALVAVEHGVSVAVSFECIDAARAPFGHRILRSEDGFLPRTVLGMVSSI